MMTLTNLVSSFAMGTTVLLGQQIGCGERKQGGRTVGTAIVMFTVIALVMTAVLVIFAPQVSSIMNAPEEAFDKTVAYVRICGGGMLVIVAYNLIGCIFRGIGDSRTPLFTVAVACVFNIAGDLILCAGFKMGTSGAAFATVFAQIISVIVSFGVICKKELPFEMHKTDIGVHGRTLRKMVGLGAPIALQDLLVSISFLIILVIPKISNSACRFLPNDVTKSISLAFTWTCTSPVRLFGAANTCRPNLLISCMFHTSFLTEIM